MCCSMWHGRLTAVLLFVQIQAKDSEISPVRNIYTYCSTTAHPLLLWIVNQLSYFNLEEGSTSFGCNECSIHIPVFVWRNSTFIITCTEIFDRMKVRLYTERLEGNIFVDRTLITIIIIIIIYKCIYSLFTFICVNAIIIIIKLRGFSPQANYTDRATAACRRN
jgi:hypothetical protein